MSDDASSGEEGVHGDYAEKWKHIKNCKHLIHAAEHYCVFIDTVGDLDWETTREYDKQFNKTPAKHNAVLNLAALLESTPCNGLTEQVQLQFKRLIGEGVARSFGQDYQSAISMLNAAKSYVVARGEETSRLWYLSASFATTSPFVFVGAGVWVWRAAFSQAFGISALWMTLAAVSGAMGALLSVITRTGKLKLDCSSGRKLHYLEGGSRICAGALSGIAVGFSIISGFFLSPLTYGGNTRSVIMLAAFAAGSVERLATSIISTVGAGHVQLPKASKEPSENTNDD